MKDHLFALRTIGAVCFSFCVFASPLLAQGPLTPPGAPGPTMKTLDQIDTHVGQAGDRRIPIDAAHTPGDSADEFVITVPGSYYLTGNLVVAKTAGIEVKSDGVTIDLNGFSVTRGSGSGGDGIFILGGADVTVKNGRIAGFGIGLQATSAVIFGGGDGLKGGKVQHLTVTNCSAAGLIVGGGWRVESCLAHDNPGNGIDGDKAAIFTDCSALQNGADGFSLAAGSVVKNCSSLGNTGAGFAGLNGLTIVNSTANANKTNGISVTSNATITGCAVGQNGSGATGSGIVVTDGAVISDCSVSSNVASGIQAKNGCTITHCTAQSNIGDGIKVAENVNLIGCTSSNNGTGTIGSGISTSIRATISGCSAIGNKGDGIVFGGDSFVLNNHASTNGGAGFHDLGSASRIDGNVSRENTGTGILASSADTVVRNSSGANGGAAYGPTAGANWGPVGLASNATSPWANF